MVLNLQFPYVARPARMEDAERATVLFNITAQAINGTNSDTPESVRFLWKSPGFNLERDTLFVQTPEGELVAYAELWDTTAPYVHKYSYVCVHPDHQGHGLGTALATWLEENAFARVALAPEGTRVALMQGMPQEHQSGARLLQGHGFRHVRSYYQMRIEMEAQLQPPILPDGITIRLMQPGEERAVIYAVAEAFRDHWGFVEEPFEERYARTMTRMANDPDYDPGLWFLAMEGDKIAAFSLGSPKTPEDEHMGWINQLGVLRPWRRKGLGLALLQHSFGVFYQRGTMRVGLGVDASSLTGATRLYERAGMHIAHVYDTYEKELRSGKELGTETLQE